MAKIAVATLGCKVNQYESAGLAEALQQKGHDLIPFAAGADIYIINTCTVTAKTDYQSRQLIRRAHRQNPHALIVVTGCYAQIFSHTILDLPGVKLIVGNGAKESIPALIEEECKDLRCIVNDIKRQTAFSGLTVSTFSGHTRAFLKIQDGCDAFCSYCIVPYARGPGRSLPEDDVIKQIRQLTANKYKEIVLTGIHLGLYGRDLSPSSGLLKLLQAIETKTDVERIRLSSLEPMEITNDLIDYMKGSGIVCRHLHIPLQGGDDVILSAMKRNYTTADFRNTMDYIFRSIPGIAIGTDIMAGFPGESEREFQNTFQMLKEIPFAYFHVFPYSSRPGTPAAELPDQVQENLKKARCKILRELGEQKRKEFYQSAAGKDLFVLIESTKDKKTGFFKGFSENYIPVLVSNACASDVNQIVQVTADRMLQEKLLGRKK